MNRESKIYLNHNVYLNCHKIKRSRAECLILLRQGAEWYINGPTELYYGAGIQVHDNALLENGELYMNTGSLIICGFHIKMGDTISMARNAYILDDDHHPIYNENGVRINEPKEIVIGNHVWLGMKSTVLKGAKIGDECVIGANSLIANEIPNNLMVASSGAKPVIKNITWHR